MGKETNINITASYLLKQFEIHPRQTPQVKKDLVTGINWLRQKGHIDIVLDTASNLPKYGDTNIFKKYIPAIAFTNRGMGLILKDDGVMYGWDDNSAIAPPGLVIARTFKLIGDKESMFNRDVLTMFVPREIPSFVKAMENIRGQFNGRVHFLP